LSESVRRQQADLAEFNERFAHGGPHPVLVPAIVALNVLAYVWLGVQGAGWLVADSKVLIQWGSLFGPLANGGQWWRLLTAAFLHGGIVHLTLNMYALYDSGRLCEQLFGRVRFFAIYFISAIAGSVVSLWWNPYVNSVGASGAVFGVYGALLAFMLDKRNGVPLSVMRTHQISIMAFIAYSVINGIAKTGIDNAAHAGGLIAGAVLGWALARPIGERMHPSRALRALAGVVATCVVAAALFAMTPNTRGGLDAIARFRADMQWLDGHERKLAASMDGALGRLRTGKTPSAQTQREIAALAQGWAQAHQKLSAYRLDPRITRAEFVTLHTEVVTYLDLRRRAMLALAQAVEAQAPEGEQSYQEFNRLWKESGVVLARIDQLSRTAAR
jgi:rhomboid protease GluP